MKNQILITIVACLVVGAGAFYGGMQYQLSKTPVRGTGNFAAGNFAGRGGRGAGGPGGGGFVSGSVISKDANSFTVSLNNNSGSKVVFFSTSTRVGETTNGSVDDIAAGKDVMVTGSTNSDGSVTAQMVQIRPANSSSTTR